MEVYHKMAMILPDDVLGVIRELSQPCTRPDWKRCKRMEAWQIENYYDYHYFLLNELGWHVVTNEHGYMFHSRSEVAHFLKETNMVNRLLKFQENMPLEIDRMDMLYVWFEHNWAAGIAALPA